MIRKKPITKDAALLRMADLCARAEHSSFEIREKLRRLMLSSSEIGGIIDYLIENRYIDDNRFAKAFCRDKVRFAAWGRNKIRAALVLKRIPSADIREALDEIDETEYSDSIIKAATTKAKSLDLTDYNDRTKLFRHLASRGFETSIISKTIRNILT